MKYDLALTLAGSGFTFCRKPGIDSTIQYENNMGYYYIMSAQHYYYITQDNMKILWVGNYNNN